jgi:superfamily I DNA and RNA helicase
MLEIIRGGIDKPDILEKIEKCLKKEVKNGILYYGYPILASEYGSISIDATLITPKNGIVLFHFLNDNIEKTNSKNTRDLIYSKILSRLTSDSNLMNGRELIPKINVITYAPYLQPVNKDDSEMIINNQELEDFLNKNTWNDSTEENYQNLVSSIQNIANLGKNFKRLKSKKEKSRGAKVETLENYISNLDAQQSRAVIETVEGPQRIRGLAGSGKTIVLALKIAYLHAQFPELKIAVTFNTRSLKGQFKHLIELFYYRHLNQKPDWNKVKIIHAWGSSNNTGIYYEICKEHNIEYYDFSKAKNYYGYEGAFSKICKKALGQIKKFKPMYDVILIDEAQDFSEHFFNLCYNILNEPKRLIWAYDELQNLSINSMKNPEELFGKKENGEYKVILKNDEGQPLQDIILDVCYRNSRPILGTAHALGFGVYRKDGLVQMFEDTYLWEKIGYKIENGELKQGSQVTLYRNNKTSPKYLEDHSELEDIIKVESFKNKNEQAEWVANEIEKNLKEEELNYKDILVIHCNARKTKSEVGDIRNLLFDKGINSNIAGITTSQDEFFKDDSIIFTSIYRAKGNEAYMVYIIDAHECFEGSELIKRRNTLFTAITRSKAWVRITGYGDKMESLKEEINKIKSYDYKLSFNYPTLEEMEKLKTIHRDLSTQDKTNISNFNNSLKNLLEGKISKHDINEELLEKLKDFLNE